MQERTRPGCRTVPNAEAKMWIPELERCSDCSVSDMRWPREQPCRRGRSHWCRVPSDSRQVRPEGVPPPSSSRTLSEQRSRLVRCTSSVHNYLVKRSSHRAVRARHAVPRTRQEPTDTLSSDTNAHSHSSTRCAMPAVSGWLPEAIFSAECADVELSCSLLLADELSRQNAWRPSTVSTLTMPASGSSSRVRPVIQWQLQRQHEHDGHVAMTAHRLRPSTRRSTSEHAILHFLGAIRRADHRRDRRTQPVTMGANATSADAGDVDPFD